MRPSISPCLTVGRFSMQETTWNMVHEKETIWKPYGTIWNMVDEKFWSNQPSNKRKDKHFYKDMRTKLTRPRWSTIRPQVTLLLCLFFSSTLSSSSLLPPLRSLLLVAPSSFLLLTPRRFLFLVAPSYILQTKALSKSVKVYFSLIMTRHRN